MVDNIFQFLDKDHDSLVTMEELVAAIDGLEREMPTVEEQDSTVDPEGELAEYLHNPDTNFPNHVMLHTNTFFFQLSSFSCWFLFSTFEKLY